METLSSFSFVFLFCSPSLKISILFSLSLCLHSPHCCNSPLRCFFPHNVWFHFLYSSYDFLPFLLQKLSQPTPHREGHVSNVSSSFQTLVYAFFLLKYFLGLDGVIHFTPKIHLSPFVWCPENCPIRTYISYLPCHLGSSLFHPDHRTKWRDHPYLPPSGHRFSGLNQCHNSCWENSLSAAVLSGNDVLFCSLRER